MSNIKKAVALILAAAMVFALAACKGGGSTSGTTAADGSQSETTLDTSKEVEIVMYFISDRPAGQDIVDENMNKLFKEKLNCTLQVNWIPWSDYSSTYNLKLSSGEPIDLIYTAKFYECQDYVIETNHLVHLLEMIGSQKTMDSLPDDVKAIVEEAAMEANQYEREYADGKIQSEEDAITEAGTEILVPSEEMYAAMKEAALPVYDSIRGQIGDELVDTMLSLAEKYSAE